MPLPGSDDGDLEQRLDTLEAELAEVQQALARREEPVRAPVHAKEQAVAVAREWASDLRGRIVAFEHESRALDQLPEALSTQVPRAARLCLSVMVILSGIGTLPDGSTLAALGALGIFAAAIAWGFRDA